MAMMKGGISMASLLVFSMISFILIMLISRTLADQEQNVDKMLTPFVESGSSNSITTIGVKPQGWFSVKKCKKTVGNIDDCLWAMYYSWSNSDHKFAKPCCETIADLGIECVKLKVTNALAAVLPYVIKFACGFIPDSVDIFSTSTTDFIGLAGIRGDYYGGSTSSKTSNINKVTLVGTDESSSDDHLAIKRLKFFKCVSDFRRVEGCSGEVVASILGLQFQFIGPACCKAITEINAACWSQIVPFNPFFPTLLKGYCASELLKTHIVEPPTSSIPPV